MRVVIIADKTREAECRSKATSNAVNITFFNDVETASVQRADALFDFLFVNDADRIKQLKQFRDGLVFIDAVEHTLPEIDASFTRINAWPGFLKRDIIEISGTQSSAFNLLDTMGWKYKTVADVPGMISARVISMIVNEAYFAIGENVSSENEIDVAMKLGTNYPFGPMEWAKQIGIKNIYSLLMRLSRESKRYEPAPALVAAIRNNETN